LVFRSPLALRTVDGFFERFTLILLDAFRVHALHDPGTIIMTSSSGDAVTYREAWNVSELLGAHLIERTERGQLNPDDIIAVLGTDHPLLLSCCFACTKSGHGYRIYSDEDAADAALLPLILTTSKAVRADDLQKLGTQVLDAHKVRTYIVPGMTDDFSCGCGTDDCTHGPFLQECSPAEWLDDSGVFAVLACNDGETADPASTLQMTAAEHDLFLADALDVPVEDARFSLPLDLTNPQLAAVIARGKTLLFG
jgi:hypothetical protein